MSSRNLGRFLALLLVGGLLGGCAPTASVKPGYDFSAVRRVAVLAFEGEGGATVADEWVRQLLRVGVEVVERRQLEALLREQAITPEDAPDTLQRAGQLLGVDTLITGTVSEFVPAQRLLVFLGKQSSSGSVVVTHPVVPLSGSNARTTGSVFGLKDSEVVSVSATVGASARMVDVKTGGVVWASNASYEGVDIQSATETVVLTFLNTLRPVWPPLSAKRPGHKQEAR
ncbi:MAG: hypothetical protein HYZ73_04865 [Elusimicrobia bacterium]|nr:hypothetical protein [Elusimicrobiota bacterium]